MTEARNGETGAVPFWGIVAGGVAGLVILVLAGAVGMAAVWHDELVAADRLLPGTSVAGVDLGNRTVAEARTVAEEAGRRAMERTVTLTHVGERWELSPVDVKGFADVETAVAAAARDTREAAPLRVAMARYLGTGGSAIPVRLSIDEGALEDFLDGVVAQVDRQPRDATVVWGSGGAELVPHQTGHTTQRAAARDALRDALVGKGPTTVTLPVEDAPFQVATALVEPVVEAVRAAAEQALDRPITVVDGDRTWTVTPRELGATPELQPLVDEAVAALPEPAADGDVVAVSAADQPPPIVLSAAPALAAEETALEDFVDAVAAEVDVPLRDAGLNLAGGWVELVPEQAGRIVDRRQAVRVLADALGEPADRVELPTEVAAPTVTADAYEHVLLVRQDQRKLYLFVDGEVAREWPVAIGAAGHGTPTGIFTVGAKRHSPTWINPAPNGWGASMPAQIGPGPNNPLGLRALNWLKDGRETLIRFHGTANLGSIGTAASKGCIRLRNADVVELYDLVPSGTTIVSTWG